MHEYFEEKYDSRDIRLSVGPRFRRTRVVILCWHRSGYYFLLCSCFLFQRELYICDHCAAVKRSRIDVFSDVHFRWHLVYEMQDLTLDPMYERTSQDGTCNGPGVKGIPEDELLQAINDTPQSRDGVHAWLQEGGMSYVPASVPVWGLVSKEAYLQEQALQRGDINACDGIDCLLNMFINLITPLIMNIGPVSPDSVLETNHVCIQIL